MLHWLRGHRRFLSLALVILLGAIAALKYLEPNRHLDWISRHVSNLIEGEFKVRGIDWGWVGSSLWLRLERAELSGSQLIPADIGAASVYLEVRLTPLLEKTVALQRLRVEMPVVTVRLRSRADTLAAEGVTGLDGQLPANAKRPDTSGRQGTGGTTKTDRAWNWSLARASLSDGHLTLVDEISLEGQSIVTTLDRVEVELSGLMTGGTARLSAKARHPESSSLENRNQPETWISAEASLRGLSPDFVLLEPWLEGSVDIGSLSTSALEPYLDDPSLAARLAGRVTAALAYAGNLNNNGDIELTTALDQLEYRDPEQRGGPFPASELSIAIRARHDASDLDIAQLQLDSGELSLNGAGRITDWRNRARLVDSVFRGHLPLVNLNPMLPWQRIDGRGDMAWLRTMFASPGVLDIDALQLPDAELRAMGSLGAATWLEGSALDVTLHDVSFAPGFPVPAVERLSGHVSLRKGVLSGRGLVVALDGLSVPSVAFSVSDLAGQPKADLALQGRIDTARMSRSYRRDLQRRFDLAELDLSGEVELQGRYDWSRPDAWSAQGTLQLDSLRLSSLTPKGELSASGRIRARRERQFDVSIEQIDGRLNDEPFTLSGDLYALGSMDLLADVRLKMVNLDLAKLAPWSDELAQHHLSGRLNTDLELYIPKAEPLRTRARGLLRVDALGLRLADSIDIEGGSANLLFKGHRALLQNLALEVNEQVLFASGSAQIHPEPVIQLHLSSPIVDFDRVFPAQARQSHGRAPRVKPLEGEAGVAAAAAEKQTATELKPRQLPSLARQVSVSLGARLDEGRWQGRDFSDLVFALEYRKGHIEHGEVAVDLGIGKVRARASADLLDVDAIPFSLDLNVDRADLDQITTMLNKKGTTLASGELNGQGSLRGNSASLPGSLNGSLTLTAGPGEIHDRSFAAQSLFKIISLINLQGIISGDLWTSSSRDVLPYYGALMLACIDSGTVRLQPFELRTPAFSGRAVGDIDLTSAQFDIDAATTSLGAVDTTLSFLPVLGRYGSDLSRVYLRVSGDSEKPVVEVQVPKLLPRTIHDQLAQPMGAVVHSHRTIDCGDAGDAVR